MHKGAGAEHSVLVVMLLICANLVMASKAGYEQHDPTLLASLQLHRRSLSWTTPHCTSHMTLG
jgi:hypothetical protein